MGPCKILRSLSFLRSSPKKSSVVVPLSSQSSFKGLRLKSFKERALVSGCDLGHNLSELVSSLKLVSDLENESDRVRIEEYLEDGVELLDICNFLVNKIESVKSYSESVKRAVRWKDTPRVKALLSTKKYNRDDASIEKCFGRLKRLQRRRVGEDDSLTRSTLNDVAEKCLALNAAISFKKGMMVELSDVVGVAKKMKDSTAEVDDVEKKCDVLGDVAMVLEEKVKEVYKELVSVRMVLLGIVSYC